MRKCIRIFTRLSLIWLSFTLVSCERKWEESIKKMDSSMLHNNSPDGWVLIQEIEDELATDYTVEKIDGDTLKTLFFVAGNDGSIFSNEYRKRFPCGEDTCHLVMMSNDTIYFYKEKLGEKTFLFGGYEYQYIHMLLNSDELDYYLLYEDSLKEIRGNHLPKLPPLTEVEKRKLRDLGKAGE